MSGLAGVDAMFYVSKFEMTAYGPKGSGKVTLQAVSRGDQNKHWSEATPGGTIEMNINNPPAAKFFVDHLGDDISITFRPARRFTPGDGHPFRESQAQEGTAYGPPYCGDCARPREEHSTPGSAS